MATRLDLSLFFTVVLLSPTAVSSTISCCLYCRSEPKAWVTPASTFKLADSEEVLRMLSPPAFLMDDEEEALFEAENRDYKLHYAGAPMQIQFEDLSDPDELISKQYIQVDLADVKRIHSVITQGGFYVERIQGLYPRAESWVSEYVLSYSNETSGFQFFRTETGQVAMFQGNSDFSTPRITAVVPPIAARYVRYHPLKGENEEGAVEQANVRVSMVTCVEEFCVTPRINCLLTGWTDWGECDCKDGCKQVRTRKVRRVQACGGQRCGALKDTQTCIPPEPAWKSITQYCGIALGILLVIAMIGFIIYRKKHRDRVEVIVVKENDEDDGPSFSPGEKPRGPPVNDFNGRPMHPLPQPPGMPPMGPRFGGPQGFGPRPPFGPPPMGPRPGFPGGMPPPGGMPLPPK